VVFKGKKEAFSLFVSSKITGYCRSNRVWLLQLVELREIGQVHLEATNSADNDALVAVLC